MSFQARTYKQVEESGRMASWHAHRDLNNPETQRNACRLTDLTERELWLRAWDNESVRYKESEQ